MLKKMVLNKVNKKLRNFIDEIDNKDISLMMDKLPQGKMLRSKLILKIAGVSEESIKLSAIVEMIHLASLLHDDVIDDSLSRRGQDSLNAIYGNKTSIMFGDILYSKAFVELIDFPKEVSKSISNAVFKLSIGEIMDVNLTETFNSDKSIYMDMIYKKTASLIEASSESAAIISGRDSQKFALYGRNLGISFQVIDDILDVTSDDKTLGKPAMHDFYEGKVTLPYIILYNKSNPEIQNKLKNLYKKELDSENLTWLKNLLLESGSIDESIAYAQKLGNEAIDILGDEKNISELKTVVSDMINREF